MIKVKTRHYIGPFGETHTRKAYKLFGLTVWVGWKVEGKRRYNSRGPV